MPNRLVPLLALAVALYATGAIIASLFDLNGARTPIAAAAPADAAPMALLPAVVVRPEAEIPVLAAVTVRPDRARSATPESGEPATPIAALAMRASTPVLLPSGGFDMPYYSFGRSLRRANKE